jgi:DNA-directed RNA polymerase subunit M/transcription elongation factor TFIIS
MKNNENFRNLIIKREISAHELPYLKPIDIEPEKWKWIIEKNILKTLRIEAKNKEDKEDRVNYKGLFKCDECQSSNTRHISLQIRSADESETTFIFCKNCDIQWKI